MILARKFHGLREGKAHKLLKVFVERSLAADSGFQKIEIEKTWRAGDDPSWYKRPDVSAERDGKRFAFEIQLATTFLDVILERRAFYKADGGLLIWIFKEFGLTDVPMTVRDVLASTNSNLIVVTEETTRESEQRGEFVFDCHYRVPTLRSGAIKDEWKSRRTAFSELTLDFAEQRAFYYDFDAAEAQLKARKDDNLRDELLAAWLQGISRLSDPSFVAHWHANLTRLHASGVRFLDWRDKDLSAWWLIRGVLSAQAGKPVMTGFRQLIEVLNQIEKLHPENLFAFCYQIRDSTHESLLTRPNRLTWKERKVGIRTKIRGADKSYSPIACSLPTLNFFFPEIGEKVRSFLKLAPPRAEEGG